MSLNPLSGIISWDIREVLIPSYLAVAEWIIEIFQNFKGLKVLLLVVNNCLESCGLTNALKLVCEDSKTLIQHVKCLLDLLCLVSELVIL